jgi:hypothetical protein
MIASENKKGRQSINQSINPSINQSIHHCGSHLSDSVVESGHGLVLHSEEALRRPLLRHLVLEPIQ